MAWRLCGGRIGRMDFNRRRSIFLLVLCQIIGLPSHLTSQTQTRSPSLSIGSVQVSLGMARDRVLQLFKDAHIQPNVTPELQTGPQIEAWVICETPDSDSKTCDTDGSVIFNKGVLIHASIRWRPRATSGADIAEAFIGAAHDLTSRGLTHCEMGTGNQDNPAFSLRQMTIRCDQHYSAKLVVWRNTEGLPTAQVEEIISEKVFPIESK